MQKNISVPDDEWYEEWTSDDFMALPEVVSVAYDNQQYNPKLQYLSGVARDDAAYMICTLIIAKATRISASPFTRLSHHLHSNIKNIF